MSLRFTEAQISIDYGRGGRTVARIPRGVLPGSALLIESRQG